MPPSAAASTMGTDGNFDSSVSVRARTVAVVFRGIPFLVRLNIALTVKCHIK